MSLILRVTLTKKIYHENETQICMFLRVFVTFFYKKKMNGNLFLENEKIKHADFASE